MTINNIISANNISFKILDGCIYLY